MLHAFTRQQLFHYTTKETAIEKIFPDTTIRMGSMRATNDPRETAPWFFGWVMEEGEPDPGYEFFAIDERIDEMLKRACLIACFTKDAPDPYPEIDPDRYFREDLGLQGYEHDRMWAQYAGNHTGVCILFDRDRLEQRMKEHYRDRPGRLLHGSVAYVSSRAYTRVQRQVVEGRNRLPDPKTLDVASFVRRQERLKGLQRPKWRDLLSRWNKKNGPRRGGLATLTI